MCSTLFLLLECYYFSRSSFRMLWNSTFFPIVKYEARLTDGTIISKSDGIEFAIKDGMVLWTLFIFTVLCQKNHLLDNNCWTQVTYAPQFQLLCYFWRRDRKQH
jgi:hypothetical protein